MKRHKYNAVKTVVDGITFASKAEARRYSELKLLEKAGEIAVLQLQPRFDCVVNGKKVCTYIADFKYATADGFTIEDVKSPATAKIRAYRIKKKLVEALYDITITEVY